MINQQLLDFIKQQALKGLSKEVILKELLENGWTQIDIEEGFKNINNNSTIEIANSTIYPEQEKNNVIKKTNRIKFYFSTLIISGISTWVLAGLLASIWMFIFIPILFVAAILITVIILIIYEIRHPINYIYDKKKLKSIYIKFFTISSILLFSTIIATAFYFGPVIKNYSNFKTLELINYESPFGPNSPVGGKPSLETILTDKVALIMYAALFFGGLSLFLSLKKKELTRPVFIILIPLSLPLMFITIFYGPSKYSQFTKAKVDISSDILILENAREMKDINICGKITDPNISYQCISAVAQDIDISFDQCSKILVSPVDIGECQWRAIKKMQNPTAELCKKIDSSYNKDIVDECHLFFATKNSDLLECSLMSDGSGLKFDCYAEILKKTKNSKECKTVDKMQIHNCLTAYVSITGDSSVCSSFDSVCYRYAAVFNKDKSLCLPKDKFCPCAVDTGDVSGNCYKGE